MNMQRRQSRLGFGHSDWSMGGVSDNLTQVIFLLKCKASSLPGVFTIDNRVLIRMRQGRSVRPWRLSHRMDVRCARPVMTGGGCVGVIRSSTGGTAVVCGLPSYGKWVINCWPRTSKISRSVDAQAFVLGGSPRQVE